MVDKVDKVQIHGKIQEQIHGSVRVVSKLRHGRGRLRELLHRVLRLGATDWGDFPDSSYFPPTGRKAERSGNTT